MNDFSELEAELKKLRPAQPSAGLVGRIEQALSESPAEDTVIRPDRFRVNWVSIGFGLAAAALFLLFARVNMERRHHPAERLAQVPPAPGTAREVSPLPGGQEAQETKSTNQFFPANATQVVYNKRDEGLQYVANSEQPRRRLRYNTHQTLQWHNPSTGASLTVSYPSEEVVLIPVSGQ
jgi:hypothetical protein